jgi:hypothetical protein
VIDEYASRAAEDIAPPILRRILDEPRVLHAFSESLHREVHLQPREWTAEAGVDAGAPPEVLIIRAFGKTVPAISMSSIALLLGKNWTADSITDPVDIDQEMQRAAEQRVSPVRRRIDHQPGILYAAKE